MEIQPNAVENLEENYLFKKKQLEEINLSLEKSPLKQKVKLKVIEDEDEDPLSLTITDHQ